MFTGLGSYSSLSLDHLNHPRPTETRSVSHPPDKYTQLPSRFLLGYPTGQTQCNRNHTYSCSFSLKFAFPSVFPVSANGTTSQPVTEGATWKTFQFPSPYAFSQLLIPANSSSSFLHFTDTVVQATSASLLGPCRNPPAAFSASKFVPVHFPSYS